MNTPHCRGTVSSSVTPGKSRKHLPDAWGNKTLHCYKSVIFGPRWMSWPLKCLWLCRNMNSSARDGTALHRWRQGHVISDCCSFVFPWTNPFMNSHCAMGGGRRSFCQNRPTLAEDFHKKLIWTWLFVWVEGVLPLIHQDLKSLVHRQTHPPKK